MHLLKKSLLKIFLLLALCHTATTQKPKLIVVISYDQMRGDYVERWGNTWSKDGFLKIKNEGAYFKNCFFEHATNMTAPGHATLLTGCYPAKTGIVANDFYEPSIDKIIYSCEDSTYGLSPRNMKTLALGDMLQSQSTKSKVFAIALKDRAAILMAGQRPTGAVWFDGDKGEFTTSKYYQRPAWLDEFNDANPLMQYTGLTWTTAIPDSLALFDAVKYEMDFPGGTNIFPHALSKEPDSLLLEGYYYSPYSVHHLFQLANYTIEKETLGRDSITDILCIGVSTTDIVGHGFGPDSRELQELYIHCDRMLA
ncbi:MAG TPA: alkaline phosphatase family protein, partial [Patescibacteria group bacterium]|nr:alkaline phosphatase family protein [Patescibacteria group bacterium]